MKLIIAEKPSLGRSIADAIPGESSGKDPIYKGEYCITWLYGHILCLQEPQDYDEAYQKWSIEQLPIYFENWKQKPSEGKESRLDQIGALLEQAELVIHAGDPDEEGQLLVDEVLRWFHYKGVVKRLDTANTTKAALSRALSHMQDNGPRENDGWSAYARSVADLMVGVNMSRFFTCMNRGRTLSVGRVQTPALGLVVARDQLIEQHQKTTYFTISGEIEINSEKIPYTLQLDKDDPRLTDGKLLDLKTAESLRDQLKGKKLADIQIHSRNEAEQPPLPFNLVKLQTYCGNAWGYDPQKVMDITQKLKDSGAITYNRSDCQYLSSDHFKEAPETLPTVCHNLSLRTAQFDTSIKSSAFNDNYITAHFAIIPTDTSRDLNRFTEEEKNVYTIIAKYYLAQFMPPCIRKKTTLKKEIAGIGTLTSTSSEILEAGFHQLLPAKTEPATALSRFPDGSYNGTVCGAEVKSVETKPPARYTKTSLNEDMTRIAKYVENDDVRKLLLEKDRDKKGENGSIGTSATRASIIDGLIIRGFLTEKNRKLISTEMGREFYHVLPDEIKKPDMTAYWWVLQEQIRSGEITYDKLCVSVLDTINRILQQKFPLLNTAARIPTDRKIVGRCPRCGGYVVSGSKGYGCMNYRNGCKFTIWKTSRSSLLKNITITDKMAEALLNGDTIESRKLYSANKQTTFFGGLRLSDQGADYGADLEFVPLEKAPIGSCPLCGGDVTETRMAYSCSNYRSGCRFAIWKNPKGSVWKNITISESAARRLLKGETVTTKKLWSEAKQTLFFGGYRLEIPEEDAMAVQAESPAQSVSLQLVSLRPDPIGICPQCGGNVVESKLAFGCDQYQNGCNFTIWKNPKGSVWKKITISETDAKKLLKGETVATKKLWSEAKQCTFYGGFRLRGTAAQTADAENAEHTENAENRENTNSGDMSPYPYGLELVMLERPVLGTCPRCGSNVIEGKNGYGCSNYKAGCKFVIWKRAKSGYLQNITITEAMAIKLLAGEKVPVTRLKKNGVDRPLSGTIVLADQGSEYGADFRIDFDSQPAVGTCPRCGKPVIETALGFSCSDWRPSTKGASGRNPPEGGWNEGCKFTIWKKSRSRLFADLTVNEEMARDLLSGKQIQTDLLYSEKKGTHFTGTFVLKDTGNDYGAGYEIIRQKDLRNDIQEENMIVAEEGPDDFHHLFEHLYSEDEETT